MNQIIFEDSKKNELIKIQKEIKNNISLSNLSKEQLKAVAEYVILNKYASEMSRDIELLDYDYNELKDTFLNLVIKKVNTRLAYENAFRYFEEFLVKKNITSPFNISYLQADEYAYFLMGKNLSNGTVRQVFTAISSFYSYLNRISEGKIRNNFLGSKAKPKKKISKNNKFYDNGVSKEILSIVKNDFEIIYDSIKSKEFKAIVRTMIDCGLRVGSFTSYFSYKGKSFSTISKSKEVRGVLSDSAYRDFLDAGLMENHTFRDYNADKIKNLFKYYTKKLYIKGKIHFIYSCHDARHLFAITNYINTENIYMVSKMLNHSNVVITEEYLKGLNVNVNINL